MDFDVEVALTLIEDQPDLVVLDIDDTEVGAAEQAAGRQLVERRVLKPVVDLRPWVFGRVGKGFIMDDVGDVVGVAEGMQVESVDGYKI